MERGRIRGMKKAAGALLLDKDKKFLLQHRDNNTKKFPNYWAFFGGKIEKGESPEQAVKRELREELGIELYGLKFISRYDSNQRKFTVFIFIARLTLSLEKLKKQQNEGDRLKSFSFKEIKKLKIPRFEKTILKDLFIKNIIN